MLEKDTVVRDELNSLDIIPGVKPISTFKVFIPKQIGFDRIKISPIVQRIDWVVFERAWEQERRKKKDETHFLVAHTSKIEDDVLNICKREKEDRWFSYIWILIDRCKFILRHPSLPGRKYDDCTFEIYVPRIEGHECLKNLRNQNYDDKRKHVLDLYSILEKKYGIVCDKEHAIMRNIELNISVSLNSPHDDFRDIVEWLSPYQQKIKGCVSNTYTVPDTNFLIKADDRDASEPFEEKVPQLKYVSLNSVARTFVFKIYDKSYELMDEYRKDNKDGKTNFQMDHVTRIEVELQTKEEIRVYLSKKDDFFDLTQDIIEDGFRKFVKKHLVTPLLEYYKQMDNAIEWEPSNIGGSDESIVTKAAKKMVQNEQIITNWAPALLQMCLDDLLWKDSNDIQVKKLWEYLSTYCYLPRLANYNVLEDAILRGVASDEYFALAGAKNNDRYVDLKYNKPVFTLNQSDLLVKIKEALKQIAAEKKEEPQPGDTVSNGGTGNIVSGGTGTSTRGEQPQNGGQTGGETTPDTPKNTRFFMSAKLDTTRVNRDVNTYVQEIIQHLMAVEGSDVELTLEVNVNAPEGIPSSTVRTVSENCRTLKITNFGFED